MANFKTDIVLPWVDGSDEKWSDSYMQYAAENTEGDSRSIRFRDWDLLRYWFRGVEKFMPWVNTVHFVTAGHLPDWLNINHPQINWVKHSDFIPNEYLPTFSINTIELNLHRIKNLSEHFIYFNDDIFVLNFLEEQDFFKKRLPCDYAVMTAKPSSGGIIHMAVNDLNILDLNFNKHIQIKKHWSKWFNIKYGRGLLNNLLLYGWKEFSGFIDPHLPNAFLKSTFSEVWQKNFDILDKTCRSKFRSNNDVNQWLMRYWQLAEGKFTAYNKIRSGACVDISDNNLSDICQMITEQKHKLICLNDSVEITDFEKTKALLKESFENILPEKSSFEKD